jgi:polysaccharide deacetylase 2 family uncharacterized protein YibQ
VKNTWLFCLLLSLLPFSSWAAESPPSLKHPAIALIIDDIGDSLYLGLRAVHLPGAVTCAFLPHTGHAQQLAIAAHNLNKEVMLHLPMESKDGENPGPGTLNLSMTRAEFITTFRDDLAAIPYAAGVNNHMGSLLTSHPRHMSWLMNEINQRGDLFFVDSRTTEATVAQRVAQESGVPNLRRNVFLDNDQRPEAIARQFSRLLDLAKRHGHAVAIGHPHPATLAFLEQQLPRLNEQGVQLISISQLINLERHPERLYAAAPLAMDTAKPLASSAASGIVSP